MRTNKKESNSTKANISGKKDQGQTRGQNERDPKGRKGQYTAAGDAAVTKK